MIVQTGRDWRVHLLAIASGAGGLLAIAVAAASSLYVLLERWIGPANPARSDPLGAFVLSTSLAFVGTLMLITSNYALAFLKAKPGNPLSGRPIHLGHAVILVIAWLGVSVASQLLLENAFWRWITPLLHVLAIGLPVYLLIRLATAGIPGGSRLRLWGSLVTGLMLGTGLAAAIEIGLLVLAIAGGAAYILLNPDRGASLQALVMQLAQTSGVEQALQVMQPLLVQPLALALTLLAVSGVAPVIEELAKTLTCWLLYNRLATPAQGFWCGAVSGAGFALFEGLLSSSDAGGGWAFILLIRGGSSMMHILAAGLAGWGIASYRQNGRAVHLLGGYILAMGIHSLWNASVVAMVYGGLRSGVGGNQTDLLGVAIAAAGALVLMALIAALPIALIFVNRQLRPPAAGAAAASVVSSEV